MKSNFSKSSGGRFTDAHAMNCPYSSLQNDFEQEIAALSEEQNQEGFWEDQSKAKAVSK